MDYINCIVMEESRAHILLLIKQKGPAFLLGKDNFPGGKLEEGEIPSSAVIREEEPGASSSLSWSRPSIHRTVLPLRQERTMASPVGNSYWKNEPNFYGLRTETVDGPNTPMEPYHPRRDSLLKNSRGRTSPSNGAIGIPSGISRSGNWTRLLAPFCHRTASSFS